MPSNSISQIDFGDGVLRKVRVQSSGGGITEFVDIPTVEETEFLDDGAVHELVFENLDTDKVTVSGTTSATEIGNYTCTLTLKSNSYAWKDLTQGPKTIEWKIYLPVYGVEWDGSASTTWTRTDNAAEFEDPNPYYSGMATTPGSPFDNIMPWSGMVIEERTGGTMVKIPKFWYKLSQNGNGLKIQISPNEVSGFSVSPAHMDRGDGKGELDEVYVGRYYCRSSNYKSVTQNYPARIGYSNVDSYAQRNGSDYYGMDFSMLFTLWLLYLVEFADWDSQSKIGYGYNDYTIQSGGYTDSMPYHTGTAQSSRTTHGLGIQYRYIEGLWDNIPCWVANAYSIANSYDYVPTLYMKYYSQSTYTNLGTYSDGFPKQFKILTPASLFPFFVPLTSGGSDSTYTCDNWDLGEYDRKCYLITSPYFGVSKLDRGLFALSANASRDSRNYPTFRLMERPTNL